MDQIKIGKFIADLRKENGLTQQALGDELGVTNKTISRWETGTYMPDIEMLKLLGQRFQISINELLCGERLEENDFRKVADENIVSLSKVSLFSLKEKMDFWKNKWLKEHIAVVLLCCCACMGALIISYIYSIIWLAGIGSVLWLILYMILRNRMMIYVESHVFDKVNDKQ